MDIKDISKAQEHWILAKMGKRVLRPGGKELTQQLIKGLSIKSSDKIVEFAPGIGFTANLILSEHSYSYTGIDSDNDVIAALRKKLKGEHIKFKNANASQTGLSDENTDKIVGEAMLTMHADHRKVEIIQESKRILKKGGIYAIHELGLKDVDENLKEIIQKDLAHVIKVNARPLTQEEWCNLLTKEGFMIKSVFTNKMHLLESKRIIDDEGWWRTLKISFNIMCNKAARKRINEMKATFDKYENHLNSIAIIAEKI